MKSYQFYTTTGSAALCLVLTIAAVFMGQSNQVAQVEAQQQQEEINKGTTAQQIGTNMLRDIAPLSLKNEKLKNLLSKHGYTVSADQGPASPDAAKSAPASSPAGSPAFKQ